MSSSLNNTYLEISSANGEFSVLEMILVLPICQIENCASCVTANDCSSCVDPYYLQIIKCVLACDSGFYIYGKSCVL